MILPFIDFPCTMFCLGEEKIIMKNKKNLKLITSIATLLISLLINNFALADNTPTNPQDPYQHLNEKIFHFNSQLDEAIFEPIAKDYAYIVPAPARTSVHNFFRNIEQPSVVVNDILQGDYVNAMGDTWRFFINSTLGLFGLFDVAGKMNVPIAYRPNDFGLTLMYWGLNDPKYFVIPFFGPSTDVDFLGRIVDYYAFMPYPYIHPWYIPTGMLALYYINERAQYLQYNQLFASVALDPYVFQRNAYLQLRQNELAQIKQEIHAEYTSSGDTEPGYFLKPSRPWNIQGNTQGNIQGNAPHSTV